MPSTKNLLLRLDPALAEQLAAVAEIEERPVSDVVREAIRALVSQRRRDDEFQKRLKATAKAHQRLLRQLEADER